MATDGDHWSKYSEHVIHALQRWCFFQVGDKNEGGLANMAWMHIFAEF